MVCVCVKQAHWFVSRLTVSRVYQEWSTTQRTPSQLDTTVGSIGVNMGQHPCGILFTPHRVAFVPNVWVTQCIITLEETMVAIYSFNGILVTLRGLHFVRVHRDNKVQHGS